MRARPLSPATLAALLTLAACAAGPKPDPAHPRPAAFVEVQNEAFLDMTIRLVRNDVPIRLGVAPGKATVVLPIPASLVRSGYPIRFVANPIGGNRAPHSEWVSVWPGDTIVLRIPPT